MHSVQGEKIVIQGAREHNLKNISVEIPRNKLVVISGLSGSGKSSLAFDTLFAEGQRRYMESLSSYARQFLGSMDKPDVDLIEGLSPAISIEQKTTHNNPRSTVGTVTEIYDYYRLLFARIGHAHCPNCGREIKEQSEDQIIDTILGWGEGTRLTLLAPVIRGKKGEHQKIIEDAQKSGFVRARIDGLMVELDDTIKLDKQKKHTIEIVVDRIALKEDSRKRLAESVEAALQAANGVVIVLRRVNDDSEKGWHEEEVFFSQKNACPDCGISVPELQPRLFSFNNPFGACPECTGIGEKMEWDAKKILPDDSLSFNEGAFPFYNPDSEWNRSLFGAVAETGGFTLDTPVKDLSDSQREFLWKGDDTKIMHWIYRKQSGEGFSEYKRPWIGIWADMKRRHNEAWGESQRVRMEERFMSVSECRSCHGKRLRPEALGVTVGGKNIIELCSFSVIESLDFIEKLQLTDTEKLIASQIIKEIKAR
ncbi:MAG: excinuclease ABC subunit UvrA, partial [Treponema sp.]|nr:excinuclease ABC subunit UvrA [Treponema sp.]